MWSYFRQRNAARRSSASIHASIYLYPSKFTYFLYQHTFLRVGERPDALVLYSSPFIHSPSTAAGTIGDRVLLTDSDKEKLHPSLFVGLFSSSKVKVSLGKSLWWAVFPIVTSHLKVYKFQYNLSISDASLFTFYIKTFPTVFSPPEWRNAILPLAPPLHLHLDFMEIDCVPPWVYSFIHRSHSHLDHHRITILNVQSLS